MLDFLFTIIIYPIRLLIECIYTVLSASVFKENIGVSLAGLSIAVNILCLPLYAKAEQLQELERNTQKKMAKRITSIRKHFKGDEQYLLLSMYYRENHYHPLMALRSSLSLLLQIPFFIAAYSFLSHLDSLHGKSLFFIRDVSAADALFTVQNVQNNILPLLMTAINIIAGLVYSKGFPLKEKVQLYVMSLFFLILLYHSPAALVLYWTMNNIFSLVKNILFKVKNPGKIVYIIGCVIFASFMLYVWFFRYNEPRRAFRNKAFAAVLFFFFTGMPFYVRFMRYLFNIRLKSVLAVLHDNRSIFILSCACLWVLIGCYIPVNLAASDPLEFASIGSPFTIISHPVIQGLGLFLFWPLYLFFLFSKKIKSLMSFLFAGFAFCALGNFFIFHGNYGTISSALSFKIPSNVYLAGSLPYQMLNIGLCAALIAVLFVIILFKKIKWIMAALSLCIAGMLSLCVFNLIHIRSDMLHYIELREKPIGPVSSALTEEAESMKPVFTLSKTGKNVFIIMLDNAVSSYFPIFLEKNPEYYAGFSGFTYYPNTATFFRNTLFGTPALFGGYEYATYRMNERTGVSMKDKHNEAMLLLPEIFKEQGFDVTVTNMPYINYASGTDTIFFRERGIKSENILGRYREKFVREVMGLDEFTPSIQLESLLRRNILLFAVFETSICSLRDFIYQNGQYWSSVDYSLDSGINEGAIRSYTTLYYLPEMTGIAPTHTGTNTFSIMINDLTHEPGFLQYPGYTLEETITEKGENFFNHDRSLKNYHVNAASYILLSKWFDYLKANEVWDNTRIIIVSDHGDYGITHPDFTSFQNIHTLQYNPILLVKDFQESGDIKTVDDFMTNADTPLLALKDIVEGAKNPFTGNALSPDKKEGIYIFTEGFTNPGYYSGATCLEDGSKFFYLRDSVFEKENWQEVRYRDFRNRL